MNMVWLMILNLENIANQLLIVLFIYLFIVTPSNIRLNAFHEKKKNEFYNLQAIQFYIKISFSLLIKCSNRYKNGGIFGLNGKGQAERKKNSTKYGSNADQSVWCGMNLTVLSAIARMRL